MPSTNAYHYLLFHKYLIIDHYLVYCQYCHGVVLLCYYVTTLLYIDVIEF